MDSTLQSVQRRLIALGYNPGPAGADGIPGRFTTGAIAAFQKAKALDIRYPGTIGPKTLSALELEPFVQVIPPWMTEARRYMGLHEVKNAKTLDKALRLDASEIAWCGAFVGLNIAAALPKEPLPANPLGSRNWLKFGKPVDEVFHGSVCVFWRGSKTGWQGHVGFVAGHDQSFLHVLGGNQSNSVSLTKISKSRLLGYRWPTTYPMPVKALGFSVFKGSVSTNEA